MKPTPMRVSSPADLLALVPCVFGFHPEDSLVLVVVAGKGGSNLHARVDLCLDEDERRAGLATLLAGVRRAAARQVVLIAYTDDVVLAQDTVEELTEELLERDVDVLAAIRADGARWYSLDCDDDCCPAEGRPYDVSAHPITAQSVLEGKVTFRNRGELADSLIGTDTDDVEAVAAAADEATRRLQASARHPLGMPDPADTRRHLVAEGQWVRDRVRRYLATQEPLDVEEAGRMAVAVATIDVRDVAWSEMTRFNARTHVELWRELVRRVPVDLLAAPAALLGFAAWLSGDGALAWCAIERCQQSEPDYSMAALLSQALVAAVPPSTWRPLPPEALALFAG